MSTKKGLSLLVGLHVGMLLGLSACGSNAGVSSPPSGRPDSVSIQIDNHRPTEEKPAVTLTVATMVQQLYTTIYTLPQMPNFQACMMELGPTI